MMARQLVVLRQRWRNLAMGARLFLFSTALLAAFLLLAIIFVSIASYRFAGERVSEELAVGERVFQQVLLQKQGLLRQSAQVLAADFGFREALATTDADTIASALLNHGSRINASLAVALDLNGRVLASTTPQVPVGEFYGAADALRVQAASGGETGAVAFVGNRPLELVMVPVRAPLPVGWVMLGFELDDAALQEVSAVVEMDVSLLAQRDGQWMLYASSVGVSALPGLAEGLPASGQRGRLLLDGRDLRWQGVPLATADGSTVSVVLTRSFDEALAPYRQLRLLLVLLLCAGFVAAVPLSRLIARSFSRPLEQLTRKAEAISRGQYDQPLGVDSEDEIGQLAISVNTMSQAIAEREREITRRAYYDVLTGLPNRQMISLLGDQALMLAEREQRALAVLALDIERFQAINDALGYHTGDRLLCAVGERLRDVLRDADAVSRPGGNEFLALLHTHETLNIASLHRRIEQAFDRPVEVGGHPVDVALALGIALYPDHGNDMQTLLRNAEIALAAAKRDRIGLVVYTPALDETRVSHLTLLSDLKRAVERDELVMYLQPKVDVRTGEVRSAEALVRWQHPERGFVPPGEFIPFAEQSGRIGMLTHWMLGRAMKLSVQWAAAGRPVQISVNVSTRDILDERFPQALRALLEQHDGRAEWLRLEITESGLMEDAERALRVLHQIRELGFTLSIDDFGTGYSSLSYLKKMPVAELKIDRSFVHGARAGSDAAVLLRSTIELGHNLALSVVAEGVETGEEWALLQELGCDYIQGYLASRPLPVDEFEQWVATQAPFRPLAVVS